jgi:hypothetical protein
MPKTANIHLFLYRSSLKPSRKTSVVDTLEPPFKQPNAAWTTIELDERKIMGKTIKKSTLLPGVTVQGGEITKQMTLWKWVNDDLGTTTTGKDKGQYDYLAIVYSGAHNERSPLTWGVDLKIYWRHD